MSDASDFYKVKGQMERDPAHTTVSSWRDPHSGSPCSNQPAAAEPELRGKWLPFSVPAQGGSGMGAWTGGAYIEKWLMEDRVVGGKWKLGWSCYRIEALGVSSPTLFRSLVGQGRPAGLCCLAAGLSSWGTLSSRCGSSSGCWEEGGL